MSFTSSDLAKLNAAIASGKRSVQYGDRVFTYQSTSEMLEAKRVIMKELEAAQGKRRPRIIRVTQTGTGY